MPINAPVDRILEQLRLGRQSMPEWAEVLDLHIAILELQIESQPPPLATRLGADEATRRRRLGIPLLSGHELEPDWPAFAALYTRVCQVAGIHRPDLAEAFQSIQNMPQDDPEQVRSWMRHYMAENRPANDDDSGIIAFVLNQSLRPFLRRFAADHAGLIDEEGWRRGFCPVCGGEPDYAALQPEGEGQRHLLCSRCDNEWLFKRIGCPYCENADTSGLAYYPEQDGPHRLYVCNQCRRYLKTIDLRGLYGRVLLPVERVLTIGMDVAARDQGYQ